MTVAVKGWTVGDWAYNGYKLVQVKEMRGTEVRSVTTGFIESSSSNYEEQLFPQTLANKRIAETIEIYWHRLSDARGCCMLNHPDLNRKFEEFAFLAMSAVPGSEEQKEIMERAAKFQQQCSEKLREVSVIRVDDVFMFNRNQPW